MSCQSSNVRQRTATGRLTAKRTSGAALGRAIQSSMDTAMEISCAMWMREEVPVEMLTRQGGCLLRWHDLLILGRKAA